MEPLSVSWQFLGYLLAFGTAATVCGIAVFRARKIEDDDTRAGLVGLLATTSGWAFLELGLLVVPVEPVAYGFYVLSLIVGLATVGGWLHFCSAYTGRSFHTNSLYRRLALIAYLVIVAVKLTNPLHGLYFTAELTKTPFLHLAVRHELLHWVVSGIAYALASVGLFMLYEMFLEANYDTKPLAVLSATTALPVIFDIVGFSTGTLLDINYEPLGVAVFALGVLYVYKDRFFAVQLGNEVDQALVHIGDGGQVLQVSEQARQEFPLLAGAAGASFDRVFPAASAALESSDGILEWSQDGETRYYLVSDISATLGQTDVVQTVVFSDVTETETRRRELERHDEQLEGFAAAIRHNLLNTIQVIEGRVAHAENALEAGSITEANESLVRASAASSSMTDTVENLAILARDGQTVSNVAPISFGDTARNAFATVDPDGMELSVDRDGTIQANERRLHRTFQQAFEFAQYNDATTVRVALRDDGFDITDDGDPPADADVDAFFEYGGAVPESGTGMTLPNLEMLARTQGWDVTIDMEYRDGFQFRISGAVTDPAAADAADRTNADASNSRAR